MTQGQAVPSAANTVEALAHRRDEVLDQWLAHCSTEDREYVARYLVTGGNEDRMPMALRRCQDALNEAIDGAIGAAWRETRGEAHQDVLRI